MAEMPVCLCPMVNSAMTGRTSAPAFRRRPTIAPKLGGAGFKDLRHLLKARQPAAAHLCLAYGLDREATCPLSLVSVVRRGTRPGPVRWQTMTESDDADLVEAVAEG